MHSGTGAGTAAATMPWHVMRNGTTSQYTRGRADEVAVYGTALPEATIRAHFAAGRDVTDTTAPAAPAGLTATPRLERVELDWSDVGDADLDGYDVFRATSAAGPFTRVNAVAAERLRLHRHRGHRRHGLRLRRHRERRGQQPEPALVAGVRDAALHVRPPARVLAGLRYEAQESYFADSAAEMTDNFVSGSRQNYLVSGSGTRLAAANPADPLANLSLAFLGDPTYADGRTATASDYLDAANASYQQDAQRMRAAGYGDRVYGRVLTSGGKTWLQYWLFSYYNPQNVLGFGVHEGDWEFIQVGLNADGAPDVATYAQHGGGERCAWSQVAKSGGAPVVYVALASHASYFSAGVNPRGFYPDDYHRGGGYQVRPALEIVTQATPFLAWRGKWGASSSSPVAPRSQGKWSAPNSFNSSASACTVGTAQASATAAARRTGAEVPEPQITATREGARAAVRYRFARRAALTLVVSVARPGAPDVATARRVRVGQREGVVTLRLPPGSAESYVVSASAFSERGARSAIVRAPLR